jgi:hypothetical protein
MEHSCRTCHVGILAATNLRKADISHCSDCIGTEIHPSWVAALPEDGEYPAKTQDEQLAEILDEA